MTALALLASSFILLFSTTMLPSIFGAGEELQEEKRSLDQIHKAALAEGGILVFYAGGDAPDQQDFTKQQFEERFPGMQMQVLVDYSKHHDARIDLQLEQQQLVPDLTQLQTVQDFPRWKEQGVLLPYKPRGWSKVHEELRDPDGHFLGLTVIIFSSLVNSRLMPNEADWPRRATDYLKPRFKGKKLVITYPNDDDAVLFLFKQIINKHGWTWFQKLVQQDPVWIRGTAVPMTMIANGSAWATINGFTGMTSATQEGSETRNAMPPDGDEPFVAWAQPGAIFKGAKHPEAAKLYMNWMLEQQRDTTSRLFSVRTDADPPSGFKPIWKYKNSSHKKFLAFMEDRAGVERFKTQISFFIGEPQGPPAAGIILGLTPVPRENNIGGTGAGGAKGAGASNGASQSQQGMATEQEMMDGEDIRKPPAREDNCRDVDSENCLSNMGLCKNRAYFRVMNQNCRETCGACIGPSFVCRDRYGPDCQTWGQAFCDSRVYTKGMKLRQCARSCGLCTP